MSLARNCLKTDPAKAGSFFICDGCDILAVQYEYEIHTIGCGIRGRMFLVY